MTLHFDIVSITHRIRTSISTSSKTYFLTYLIFTIICTDSIATRPVITDPNIQLLNTTAT